MSQPYNSLGIPVVSNIGGGGGGGSVNISAGTTSNNLTALTFSNSNGVSFGLNGSVITATVATNYQSAGAYLTTAALSDHSHGNPTLFLTNLSGTTNSNSAGFTLSLSAAAGGGGGITNINVSAGTTSQNLSAITFSNQNGVSFGLNGSVITGSHNGLTTAAQSDQVVNSINGSTGTFSFNTGSSLSSSRVGNAFTWGLASNITTALQSAGAYLTTARASNDAVGLNTAQTNVTWTVNSSGISLNAAGYAGTGTTFNGANLSGSMTLNSNGLNLSMSAAAAGGGGAVNFSAGTTSNNLQSVIFANSNGVSFGLGTGASSQSITATVATNYQSQGAYLTTARASNDGVGLNTAQTNVTWTVNSSGISFNAGGYAGTTTAITGGALVTLNSAGFRLDGVGLAGTSTGFAGANISGSMTHNSAGLNLSLSVAAPGGGGAVNFSAGTTSQNLQSVIFANSNGVSFGLGTGASSQSITASVAAGGGGVTLSELAYSHFTNSAGLNWTASDSCSLRLYAFDVQEHLACHILQLPISIAFATAGTSSCRQTHKIWAGIYSQGTGGSTSILSALTHQSFSLALTYNNSTISISQPNSTNSAGYTYTLTSSAGLNLSSGYTGNKLVNFPIGAQTLTPGRYWVGVHDTKSTVSFSNGIAGFWMGVDHQGFSLAPIGSFSSAYTTGSNMTRRIGGAWLGILDGVVCPASSVPQTTIAVSNCTAQGAIGRIVPNLFYQT